MIRSSHRPLPDNTQHSRQTSMPPMGFEPTISAGERPQTYVFRPRGHWDRQEIVWKQNKTKQKKKKAEVIIEFLKRAKFFPRGNKNAKRRREEYCWAITQAAERSCCGPPGSSVYVITIETLRPCQSHSRTCLTARTVNCDLHNIRLEPYRQERNCRRASVHLHQTTRASHPKAKTMFTLNTFITPNLTKYMSIAHRNWKGFYTS